MWTPHLTWTTCITFKNFNGQENDTIEFRTLEFWYYHRSWHPPTGPHLMIYLILVSNLNPTAFNTHILQHSKKSHLLEQRPRLRLVEFLWSLSKTTVVNALTHVQKDGGKFMHYVPEIVISNNHQGLALESSWKASTAPCRWASSSQWSSGLCQTTI